MDEDRIERAIQFLLDNQAAHDARLGRLEEIVAQLTINQDKMQTENQAMRNDLYEGLRQMNDGLKQMNEGIEKLTQVSETTIQQVQNILELEIRNSTRIKRLENFTLSLDERIEGIENQNRES
jgi:hypothetical protein